MKKTISFPLSIFGNVGDTIYPRVDWSVKTWKGKIAHPARLRPWLDNIWSRRFCGKNK